MLPDVHCPIFRETGEPVLPADLHGGAVGGPPQISARSRIGRSRSGPRVRFLKSSGCARCQGNLFSYPLDEDALIGFLIRQYEKPLMS
ncbi:hypothetical protein MYE70_09415 [Marinobacter alexandrii]|uniref:hypothetical protein n=1 Tax=Marinobacter alexandrii TaxID=2570351 RepID=UPI001FFF0FF3|nr:hypothetical protein [Marinobacter alexandrii]MCK2149280.1 hypothetical protein [Marinobacter alexandrii]